jgi:hypothetical protein
MLFVLFLYGAMILGQLITEIIQSKMAAIGTTGYSILYLGYPLTVIVLAVIIFFLSGYIAKLVVKDNDMVIGVHLNIGATEIVMVAISVIGLLIIFESIPVIIEFCLKNFISKYPPLLRTFKTYLNNSSVYMLPTAIVKLGIGLLLIKFKKNISKMVLN